MDCEIFFSCCDERKRYANGKRTKLGARAGTRQTLTENTRASFSLSLSLCFISFSVPHTLSFSLQLPFPHSSYKLNTPSQSAWLLVSSSTQVSNDFSRLPSNRILIHKRAPKTILFHKITKQFKKKDKECLLKEFLFCKNSKKIVNHKTTKLIGLTKCFVTSARNLSVKKIFFCN